MIIDEYEKGGQAKYAKLSETVASILTVTLKEAGVQFQQIQHRAKDPDSLRKKMKARGAVETEQLESVVKDLAGCRVVMYTNADVALLIHSRIFRDNFEIDWERTKFHYPLDDANPDQLFISYNYVLRLKEPRASLPEYSTGADLWCEVQIQTTLDHAWSEMAHDTLYKPVETAGFGANIQKSIRDRMTDIMRKHLLPAGFDFQKVANDVQRLKTGQALFAQQPLQLLKSSANNEKRHERLKEFTEFVYPFYDDLPAEALPILNCMIEVATAANAEGPVSLKEDSMPEFIASMVLNEACDVMQAVNKRVVDEQLIVATLEGLCALHQDARSPNQRKRLVQAAEHLAKHDLHVWKATGPLVQQILVDHIKSLDDDDRESRRTLIVTVLQQVLAAEVTGTTWGFDTVNWQQGAVNASGVLRELREEALSVLEKLFNFAETEDQQRAAMMAMNAATRLPNMADTKPALLTIILQNAARIVRICAANFVSLSYELRADVEHDVLMLSYHRTELPDDYPRDAELDQALQDLVIEIDSFRQVTRSEQRYVLYKTLVGINPLLEENWDGDPFDRSFREEAVDRLATEITEANFPFWKDVIERCAATQSIDGAYFMPFQRFLEAFAEASPSLAKTLLEDPPNVLERFLPWLLKGLEKSELKEDVRGLVDQWVARRIHLEDAATYLRISERDYPGLFEMVTLAAVSAEADWAVVRSLGNPQLLDSPRYVSAILLPAIKHLVGKGDFLWVERFAIEKGQQSLFDNFTEKEVDELLAALRTYPKIKYKVELILGRLAQAYPAKVIEFLCWRLTHEKDLAENGSYEAIPYHLSYLDEKIKHTAPIAIGNARRMFEDDREGFEFCGATLIAYLFPTFGDVEAELAKFVARNAQDDMAFVVEVMRAYREGAAAESALCKDVVAALPEGSALQGEVQIVIEATGVLTGEFGRVGALTKTRDYMKSWLGDPRERVAVFAERHIKELERDMAADQRRSMEDLQLRKRQHGVE